MPTPTQEQLANRTAAAGGASVVSTTPTSDLLIQKLLGSSVISSEATPFEDKLAAMEKGITQRAEKSAALVTSKYDIQIAKTGAEGRQKLESAQAGSSFGMNTAALDKLQKDTDANLKDLEQRKNELILQGEIEASRDITQLQVQAVQFKMQAQQQAFSNLLGIANFAQSAQQQRAQESQFARTLSFQENQARNTISQKYGVSARPGESFDDFAARALNSMDANSPAAMDIKKAQSDIALNNAKIREAAQGSFEGITESALAEASRANPAIFGALAAKNPEKAMRVQVSISKMEKVDVEDTITDGLARRASLADTIDVLTKDTRIWDKGSAVMRATKRYAETPLPLTEGVLSQGLPQTAFAAGKGTLNIMDVVGSWLLGQQPGAPIK